MKPLKFLVAVLAVCWASLSSQAATFTVTSLADSGPGTLRQGLAATPTGGTIQFAVTGTITLTSGELMIGRDVTITGPGAQLLTIDGNHSSRVFNILTNTTVNISGLTITHGLSLGTDAPSGYSPGPGRGGGVLSDGTLFLTGCHISGNVARGGLAEGNGDGGAGEGGGICSHGTLSLRACQISGNVAEGRPYGGSGRGGGISSYGSLMLLGCTLHHNSARGADSLDYAGEGLGGAIHNYGILALTNCTVAHNSATGGECFYFEDIGGEVQGGAVFNGSGGSGYMVGCTISGNSCQGGDGYFGGHAYGGGMRSEGVFTAKNTIVSGNTATGGTGSYEGGYSIGPDLATTGPMISQGFNFIGITNHSSGWVASDLTGSLLVPLDPLLGPLQDNGGPTPTMALVPPSFAIDNGNSFGSTTDQRGLTRPVDLGDYPNASGGDGSDIGAYEVQAATVDIGLRMFDGTATVAIACEAPGAGGQLTSPLRIHKGGTNYGVLLVDPGAPDATKLKIQTAPGVTGIKALRKL